MQVKKHSAIPLTFIKLPFVIKIFVLSIFERPFYTGFTVSSITWFINNENCRNIYSSIGQHMGFWYLLHMSDFLLVKQHLSLDA